MVGVFEDGHVEEVDTEPGGVSELGSMVGGEDLPVGDHFCELGVTVAREELDGV